MIDKAVRLPPTDTANLTEYVSVDNDNPSANRTALQALLERMAPNGASKKVRMFVPPRFDGDGNPDPIVVNRAGSSAWGLTVPSGVVIEGAGPGSTLAMADAVANFTRLLNIQDVADVVVRNLRLDGNQVANNPAYEQNHNIAVYGASNVLIEDVESINATGDGCYVGQSGTGPSEGVTIVRLTSSGCGRNPLTVAYANDVWVIDADLDCASGGQAIDSEPNSTTASYSGLHIRGGKIRNTGGGDYALSVGGHGATAPRRNISVIGTEFAEDNAGGIYARYTEDMVIANTFGTVGYIDGRGHSRRVKLDSNIWTSIHDGIAVELAALDGTDYPSAWTVIGNTLIAPDATEAWNFWSLDDLLFSGNTTQGHAAMTALLRLRPTARSMKNIVLGPNIWKTALNGIVGETSANNTIDLLSIAPQTFDAVTTRAIDLSISDFITNLAIAGQVRNSATAMRIGNGTPYVMSGVAGNGAVWNCFGTPEAAITERIGAMALRRDGGASTTLYVKESGASTNTGWRAV